MYVEKMIVLRDASAVASEGGRDCELAVQVSREWSRGWGWGGGKARIEREDRDCGRDDGAGRRGSGS